MYQAYNKHTKNKIKHKICKLQLHLYLTTNTLNIIRLAILLITHDQLHAHNHLEALLMLNIVYNKLASLPHTVISPQVVT